MKSNASADYIDFSKRPSKEIDYINGEDAKKFYAEADTYSNNATQRAMTVTAIARFRLVRKTIDVNSVVNYSVSFISYCSDFERSVKMKNSSFPSLLHPFLGAIRSKYTTPCPCDPLKYSS